LRGEEVFVARMLQAVAGPRKMEGQGSVWGEEVGEARTCEHAASFGAQQACEATKIEPRKLASRRCWSPNGPGRFLGSSAANRVIATCLAQQLSLVFAIQER